MSIVRFHAARLAVAVTILSACSFGQNNGSGDAQVKSKWLLCDVSWIFTPYDVGSDFSLKLSFHETPLPGVRVVLTPGGELTDARGHSRVPVDAATDANGTAQFFAVRPGKYNVGAKDGLSFPSNEVTVHADGDFDKEIEIQWPLDPLPVRTLRGQFFTPGEDSDGDRPLQFATVELVDLRSSRVVETQRTIEDGSYLFSRFEPGLYEVRITPPTKEKKTKPERGDLAIELDPGAKESTIPAMNVVQSDCAGVQLLQRAANDRR